MRLDKFVATNSGNQSRKSAALAIKQGRVAIDGQTALSPALHIQPSTAVTLDGMAVIEPQPIYWMLNKPEGYICANTDDKHPTVFDLVDVDIIHPALRSDLQIAGRLDIDTTGLLLITTDGQWNHAMTSPNKKVGKRYRVTLAEPVSNAAIEALELGIELRNEKSPCKPAKITPLDTYRCLLEIHEGKYHQVKRMFAATGNKVIKLHREAIATLELDPNLQPSEYRALTTKEINSLTQ